MTSQLATRCSACGTAFRVVQDQLKVSEGWVRCGRCETVFNASEQLFDMQRDAPSAATAGGQPLAHASLPELPAADAPRPPLADAFSALLRARGAGADDRAGQPLDGRALPASRAAPSPAADSAAGAFADWPSELRAAGSASLATAPGLQARPEQADIDLLLDVPGDDSRPLPLLEGAAADVAGSALAQPAAAGADPAVSGDATTATPEFVRAAERDARWRRAPVRWALTAASAVLLLGLALQAANHFHDGLAARWPAGRPLLDSWCALAGCTIELPRRIADVTVENTALAPAGSAAGLFQLSVTLRNRGRLAVALPAVDLSLTDSNGQLVSRRALLPGELTAADPATAPAAAPTLAATGHVDHGRAERQFVMPRVDLLRPDTDTRLQAVLATDGRVVGYTVELFYP